MGNKLQFSKILAFATGVIFIACLFVGFKASYDSVIDTVVYVTAITVSGGIFGTTVKWYMNKSQSENAYKLKIALYKETSNVRYKYNSRMYSLKDTYGILKDGEDIADESIFEELESEALFDAKDTTNNMMNDAVENIEIENF